MVRDGMYDVRVCPCTPTVMQLIKWASASAPTPSGWTDQPAKALRLFPPKAGSRRPQVQNSPNPKARKKIARPRPPRLPLLRSKGGAIFFISSALSAQDLGPE